jgi:aminoglycoside phosphotransferase
MSAKTTRARDNTGVLDSLRRRYRGRSWTPVTLGLSGARVWRVEGSPAVYVKTTEHSECRDSRFSLAAEADRLRWLATQGIPVPEVVEVGSDDQFAWLVTTAVAGRTAADLWPLDERDAVVDTLADIALALHALPVDLCPFDRRLAVTVPDALDVAAKGLADLDDLDAERTGWTSEQLVDALQRTLPASEDLVVCHGDFCLPNVLLDTSTHEVTGLIDVGRVGVADRHQDLALLTRSIRHEMNAQFTDGHADRFLRRYIAGSPGVTAPRPELMAFYRLLDEFF